MVAQKFRYIGIADEATAGTAAATPEMFLHVKEGDLGMPDDSEAEWETATGRGKTIHRPGYFVMKPSFKSGLDVQILRKLLYYALGNKIDKDSDTDSDTKNDTETSYLYSTNNVLLPTFTKFMGIDLNEYVISGNVMDKLELEVSNEFLEVSGDTVAAKYAPTTLRDPANVTLNKDYPIMFHEINVHMRPKGSTEEWGTANIISKDVKKLTLSFKNDADDSSGQGMGSRFPYNIPVGSRDYGIKYDYNYLSNKYLDLLNGGSTGPQEGQGSTEIEMLIQFNFGSYGSAQLFYPRVVPTKAPLDFSGKKDATQSLEFSAYEELVTIPTTPTQQVKTDVLATLVRPIPEV